MRQNRIIREFAASIALAAFLFSNIPVSAQKSNAKQKKRMNDPIAKKVDHVDDYHGTKVADPYRWLEAPDAPETHAWVEAENKVTFDFLNQIPERAKIKERLTRLWNFERYDVPFKEAGRYFYFK